MSYKFEVKNEGTCNFYSFNNSDIIQIEARMDL